jgi:UDP-N-acetylmuramate dehydrogenase
MQLRENVPLAPYTTFGIGGPARWFAEADSEAAILEALRFAREHSLPLFVLGGGSNLLVSGHGFPGLVLHIALKGIEHDGSLFRAAAGETWDSFVSFTVSQNCAGIECLSGIPGTVGGTPVQNVGAYGQEVAETIVNVRALDTTTLAFVDLPPAACGFAYRSSIFNSSQRGRYIVSRVDFRLRPDGSAHLLYIDLRQYFKDAPHPPSLQQVSAAVREIRHAKGMLIVPGEPDCRSAGSFFRNPVVTEAHYARIAAEFPSPVPRYPAGEGMVKLPAAWLLDQAGFHKGYTLGPAGISSRHTLALINRGSASAQDILALRDRIVAAVEEKFHIHLEPEPVWLE